MWTRDSNATNSPAGRDFGDDARGVRSYAARVLTLRSAATLLAQSDSLPALRELARHLGFGAFTRASRDARRELTFDTLATHAQFARGEGRLRCMVAQLAPPDSPEGHDTREQTRRLCLAIAQAAPARYWTVITLDASVRTVCIAAVTMRPDGPRISALRVDRQRVVDSDADTFRSLAAIADTSDTLRHARVQDILGRDALSSRFYRALEQHVTTLADTATGSATPAERRELSILCASRCLFLAFLQAKGWLNHDPQFLLRQTTAHLERGRALHDSLLRPLFFGTLNTPRAKRASAARIFGDIPFLNGGLFSPTPLERKRRTLRFADDALTALLGGLLDRYRFTAHEDSTRWSEAAVDPEMLGRAFESLMAEDERHRSGSYYTPPSLVEHVVRDALHTAIPSLPDDALSDMPGSASDTLILPVRAAEQLTALRILDPACGSGAFLVHMLERLARIFARSGDPRPPHTLRQDILTRSIFGVDRNPMAVWLCELRLWLSIVIECPETRIAHIAPLPNLDHHIRVGDTLAGGTFRYAPHSARRLSSLRERYTRATGARKHTLAAALDREERLRAVAECRRMRDNVQHERAALLTSLRTRDLFGERTARTRQHRAKLASLKLRQRELDAQQRTLELGGALPFRFAAHFADVAAHGGFPLVIGNPPWVRPHALPASERTRLRTEFRSMRQAAWKAGALRAGAGTGFAAQADLAAAFIERSVQLLAPEGVSALLVPAKLWRALAGGGIRAWLHEHSQLRIVRDFSGAPALFDAAVYPSLLVAQRSDTPPHDRVPEAPVQVSVTGAEGTATFRVPHATLTLDGDAAAPWLLLAPRRRAAIERLRLAGPALADSAIGRPLLGVKCGCNSAFLVHAEEHNDETATIWTEGRQAVIERRLLRPALRGDAVAGAPRRTTSTQGELRIIWTHNADGAPLRILPPHAARWFSRWRPQLEQRRDARARVPWWTLFRTEAARYEAPRVVWADIGRRLRPRVLEAGDPMVPLNTCYVLRAPSDDDAWALYALLDSTLAHAWFDALAEPARGGFRRYMGWTVSTLPVPRDWANVRSTLAQLARSAHASHDPRPADGLGDARYVDALADAYGVSMHELEPLLGDLHE